MNYYQEMESPDPSPSYARAYMALLSTAARIERAVDMDLRDRVGLTQAQFEILARLGEARAGLRMAELADVLIRRPSGLSYQVQQLEKRGLVERVRDVADERGIIASLTDEGAAVVAAAMPGHLAVVGEFGFGRLSETELSRLTATLKLIAGADTPERGD